MTREEILALNLQAGERIFVECNISCIDPDSAIMLRMAGQWIDNDNIHSIRRVEPKTQQPEPIKIEQPSVESNYISLEDFNKQKTYERKIYAFYIAREFAEKGEEMPDDLRNEIMTYISKSPEEKTEVEGVDYVLDIDGNKMRVGDKCERAIHLVEILKGVSTVKEINGKNLIAVDKSLNSWNSLNFRKVN